MTKHDLWVSVWLVIFFFFGLFVGTQYVRYTLTEGLITLPFDMEDDRGCVDATTRAGCDSPSAPQHQYQRDTPSALHTL